MAPGNKIGAVLAHWQLGASLCAHAVRQSRLRGASRAVREPLPEGRCPRESPRRGTLPGLPLAHKHFCFQMRAFASGLAIHGCFWPLSRGECGRRSCAWCRVPPPQGVSWEKWRKALSTCYRGKLSTRLARECPGSVLRGSDPELACGFSRSNAAFRGVRFLTGSGGGRGFVRMDG